mgnify:CR=1 FL=1
MVKQALHKKRPLPITNDEIGKGLANNECFVANKAGACARNDDFIARATPLWSVLL